MKGRLLLKSKKSDCVIEKTQAFFPLFFVVAYRRVKNPLILSWLRIVMRDNPNSTTIRKIGPTNSAWIRIKWYQLSVHRKVVVYIRVLVDFVSISAITQFLSPYLQPTPIQYSVRACWICLRRNPNHLAINQKKKKICLF